MKAIRVLILFSFVLIGFNSNAQLPLSRWKEISTEEKEPFTNQISFYSNKTGGSCALIIMRKVINGETKFHILTELTRIDEGPNGPALLTLFQSGRIAKTMYANPCITTDEICNEKFTFTYQEAFEFTNSIVDALELNLRNEDAFIYAMKKQNWY